jgi:hypothetical protein
VNLFALTRVGARRIVRIPIAANVQNELVNIFSQQEAKFRSAEDFIDFDGKYKPDDDECLVINDYDDIDGLHNAIANPLGVPEIAPSIDEFESIKALFMGRVDGANRIVVIQAFDKRRILSNKGLSIFHSANVYKKIEGLGLTIGTVTTSILEDDRLLFRNFHAARQIFDLSQYYKEATDDDLKEFAALASVSVADPEQFVASADTWIRRKVSLVMQSGILDKVEFEETKKIAAMFGIDIQTKHEEDVVSLLLPEKKAELKKLLRFLDEDYFQSVLSSTLHLSNSKRLVPPVAG